MFKLYWKKFIIPHWYLVLAALVCFIIASAAGLSAPLIIKFLIDDALVNRDLEYLHLIIAGVIGAYFLRGVFSYIHGKTIAKAGNQMVAELRQKMFERLQRLDYSYFISASTGEIISLFTNDLALIQQAVSLAVPDLLIESLNLIAIMAIMIYFDWQLALVTFATLPFIIFAVSFFNGKIGGLGKLLEETLGKVTSILHQSLVTVILVQSYVREDYERHKFNTNIQQAADEFIKVQRLKAFLIALVEFLACIGLTAIIWFGGRQVINDKLTIGGMFTFLIYIINVPTPIRKITEAISTMRLGIVAWQRVSMLEKQIDTVIDGNKEFDKVVGKVKFENVNFGYLPDLGTLKDINMIVEPGDIVAVVGPSGAGKSSFANLLLRFYDPIDGAIYIDDINIKKLKMSALRKTIGFIQQEPILFNRSILDNIRYGRSAATISEVEKAAKLANAHEFIMELPGGYNFTVCELGNNLSGGQRQRIAIARAIIMNPAILLLDEPTAALDAAAEKLVMESIREVSKNRTTFLITHRLSTLIDSDKVVYLVNGQIIEMGTHGELMKKSGAYARAVMSKELRA